MHHFLPYSFSQVICDGAAGCRAGPPAPGYDPLFRSPLPGNVGAPCAACFRRQAAPGERGGLSVAVALPGAAAGCRTGGALVAVPAAGRAAGAPPGPGSGFVARFEAAAGAVTAVTVDDYGEGYADAAEWRLVPAVGGEGCAAGAFRPLLVAAAASGFLQPQAEPLP